MFNKEVYIERRRRLMREIGTGIILLMGNDESSMNYSDNHYPFRQDSNFLYFFGLDRTALVGIIDVENNEEILFGDDISVEDVVWTGAMPTLAEQGSEVGVGKALPSSEIAGYLEKAIKAKRIIHFLPPYRYDNIQKLNYWLKIPIEELKTGSSVALIKAVVAQRSIKSTEEITEIEKAVNVTIEMQKVAGRLAQEGISETEIAGRIQGIAVSAGGNLSFPAIVTVDGQILHNHSKGNILKKGQMLLVDCGAETAMHYAGDLTRTFPVDSLFSNGQTEIYNIVLQAHEAAMKFLKPGVLFKDAHVLACETLAEGLKSIGLMKGDVKEAVKNGAHAMFFQCGLGHHMGLDTHDMEDLGEEYVGYTDQLQKSQQFGLKSLRLGKELEAGYVVTVEPGIYFIPELIDWWKAENKFTEYINYEKLETYKNFGGIRIEEDLVITANGSRLLGKPLFRDANHKKSNA